MALAVGILSVLVERSVSHCGQVVDTSILGGALLLTGAYYEALAKGHRTDAQWSQGTDGAAPYYCVYTTKDDRYVAVSAVEPEFYAALVSLLGLDGAALSHQDDRSSWPTVKELFAARIRSRTRDEWAGLAAGTDACLTPVLSLSEAPGHAHHVQRGSFINVESAVQPGPIPRFSRTPSPIRCRRPGKASTRLAHCVTGVSARRNSKCSSPAARLSRRPVSYPIAWRASRDSLDGSAEAEPTWPPDVAAGTGLTGPGSPPEYVLLRHTAVPAGHSTLR
jgi:crotonobetainyl-CoA:carnitine CoA-transferase CaiB-like acyl-CoA transferase